MVLAMQSILALPFQIRIVNVGMWWAAGQEAGKRTLYTLF
jgi:hypothetical protein